MQNAERRQQDFMQKMLAEKRNLEMKEKQKDRGYFLQLGKFFSHHKDNSFIVKYLETITNFVTFAYFVVFIDIILKGIYVWKRICPFIALPSLVKFSF